MPTGSSAAKGGAQPAAIATERCQQQVHAEAAVDNRAPAGPQAINLQVAKRSDPHGTVQNELRLAPASCIAQAL